MKTRELQALKNKVSAELEKDLVSFRERLGQLQFDLAAGKVKNIKEIKAVKKAIATILTVLKERGAK